MGSGVGRSRRSIPSPCRTSQAARGGWCLGATGSHLRASDTRCRSRLPTGKTRPPPSIRHGQFLPGSAGNQLPTRGSEDELWRCRFSASCSASARPTAQVRILIDSPTSLPRPRAGYQSATASCAAAPADALGAFSLTLSLGPSPCENAPVRRGGYACGRDERRRRQATGEHRPGARRREFRASAPAAVSRRRS